VGRMFGVRVNGGMQLRAFPTSPCRTRWVRSAVGSAVQAAASILRASCPEA
jgi:hypothetical protein